jgi:molecular chaperone GrpE
MNAEFAETVKNLETTMSEDTQSAEMNPSTNVNTFNAEESEPTSPNLDQENVTTIGVDAQVTDAEHSAEILSPEAEIESEALTQLATEVESLRLQVEERTTQCMRIAADFDNFRKRTDREKSELELRVKRDSISELLPVIDSFERSRTQLKPQTDEEVNIHKSYQGVYKQLVDCLKRIGVSPMRVEGQPFDPTFHDAIMREPTDEHPEGTVIEELRRGYLLGELVLRHAMVKVATAPEEPSSPNEDISEEPVDQE